MPARRLRLSAFRQLFEFNGFLQSRSATPFRKATMKAAIESLAPYRYFLHCTRARPACFRTHRVLVQAGTLMFLHALPCPLKFLADVVAMRLLLVAICTLKTILARGVRSGA
jgi:hypothetical protein